MSLSEVKIRELLLGDTECLRSAEPILMANCSSTIVLQLDAITLLQDKSQRLVATSALMKQIQKQNINDDGE